MKILSLILTLLLTISCTHTMTVEEFLEETNVRAFCKRKITHKSKYLIHKCISRKYKRYLEKIEKEKELTKAFAIGSILGLGLLGLSAIILNNQYTTGNSSNRIPANNTLSGNCDYEWQYDSAGRRCGGRAASVRKGGRLGGDGRYTDSLGRLRLYGRNNDPYDKFYQQSLITNTYNSQETIEQIKKDNQRRHKERMCLQQSISYKKCKTSCNNKLLFNYCDCFSLKPDFDCPIKFHY